MNIKLLKPYKGLKPFIWNNINDFSVITGLNGTGKTQLLEIIQSKPQDSIKISDIESLKGTMLFKPAWRVTGQRHKKLIKDDLIYV